MTVTVYTAGPSCMGCTQTKRHLTRRGIPFTEVAIADDDKILDAAAELGLTTAPIVCASINSEEQMWDGYRPDRIDKIAEALSDACPLCSRAVAVGSDVCPRCGEVIG